MGADNASAKHFTFNPTHNLLDSSSGYLSVPSMHHPSHIKVLYLAPSNGTSIFTPIVPFGNPTAINYELFPKSRSLRQCHKPFFLFFCCLCCCCFFFFFFSCC